jgi:hypothetical protein
MPYPLGYASEREYENDCALEARNARLAAEACNDIFTVAQAKALQLACDALPIASVFMIESPRSKNTAGRMTRSTPPGSTTPAARLGKFSLHGEHHEPRIPTNTDR